MMIDQRQIVEWSKHPELLDKESLYQLRKVVNAYPYYQWARMLFLKNLYLLNMPEFRAELKKGVLYIADTSMLFYFLEGDKFRIVSHHVETESAQVTESDRTLSLIDDYLKDDDIGTKEMKLVPDVPVDYTAVLLKEDSDEHDASPLLLGHDLIDDFLKKSEDGSQSMYGLSEERKEAVLPEEFQEEKACSIPIEVGACEDKSLNQGDDEVNNISDQVDDEDIDDGLQENQPDDSSLSETLAKIYIKQQKYEKALEIIKKLNLKNPKKNAYFADQIRFLEKLIINTKSK